MPTPTTSPVSTPTVSVAATARKSELVQFQVLCRMLKSTSHTIARQRLAVVLATPLQHRQGRQQLVPGGQGVHAVRFFSNPHALAPTATLSKLENHHASEQGRHKDGGLDLSRGH